MAAVTNLLTVSVSKALGNKDEMEPGEGTSSFPAILCLAINNILRNTWTRVTAHPSNESLSYWEGP
jgi:hypothetical protein